MDIMNTELLWGLDVWNWAVITLVYTLLPYLTYKIAKKKNRNPRLWVGLSYGLTLLTLIGSPIIILVILFLLGNVKQRIKKRTSEEEKIKIYGDKINNKIRSKRT
tara:strand:+ start:121 stop:435 length:315 start_codon:yes stop_codon:yes gene_type:complete